MRAWLRNTPSFFKKYPRPPARPKNLSGVSFDNWLQNCAALIRQTLFVAGGMHFAKPWMELPLSYRQLTHIRMSMYKQKNELGKQSTKTLMLQTQMLPILSVLEFSFSMSKCIAFKEGCQDKKQYICLQLKSHCLDQQYPASKPDPHDFSNLSPLLEFPIFWRPHCLSTHSRHSETLCITHDNKMSRLTLPDKSNRALFSANLSWCKHILKFQRAFVSHLKHWIAHFLPSFKSEYAVIEIWLSEFSVSCTCFIRKLTSCLQINDCLTALILYWIICHYAGGDWPHHRSQEHYHAHSFQYASKHYLYPQVPCWSLLLHSLYPSWIVCSGLGALLHLVSSAKDKQVLGQTLKTTQNWGLQICLAFCNTAISQEYTQLKIGPNSP